MTKIYLIRHAEAEGNYYRRVHGQYDSKLTQRGYKQIDSLAERFRDEHIDALYASDLFRTMETAKAITRFHPELTIVPNPRLREVSMGEWEDLPWGNVAHDDLKQMLMFSGDPDNWHVEGSESFKHLKERITSIIKELAAKHDGQTIAVVSHGMAIRTLISEIKNIPSERIHEIQHGDNTCVAQIASENGELSVSFYNDTSHLTEGLSTFANQTWWKKKNIVDFSNLRIVPMDPEKDAELYSDCYADAWRTAHGSLVGFAAKPYLKNATRLSKEDSSYVAKAYCGDDFAGIVELDPELMKNYGAGWLSFCYLSPDYRGKGLGVQLVGHAISVFSRQQRKSLRLHVAETNKSAIQFYDKLGFNKISTDNGSICPLLLMEKPL